MTTIEIIIHVWGIIAVCILYFKKRADDSRMYEAFFYKGAWKEWKEHVFSLHDIGFLFFTLLIIITPIIIIVFPIMNFLFYYYQIETNSFYALIAALLLIPYYFLLFFVSIYAVAILYWSIKER